MGKYHIPLQVLHLLTLIATFQIPTARSVPFRKPRHSTNKDPQDTRSDLGLAIPYVSSSSVYEYIVTRQHSKHTSHDCHQPAYVIGNGQVAPCRTSTKVISISTSGSTIVSSSLVTEYYTPIPRQDTTSWSSTSTTTVFVLPTPTTSASASASATLTPLPASTAPQSGQTATVSDGSLKSLTTSEVQTLTVAPITNTSGVSLHCSTKSLQLLWRLWRPRIDRGSHGGLLPR